MRRGRGEGSISQRKDGRWVGRVELGRGPTGTRQRKTVYGQTRLEVARALTKLLARKADGRLTATTTPKLADWLTTWFTAHKTDWRPGTRRVYRHAKDGWLIPGLGHHKLDALTPPVIQAWAQAKGPSQMLQTSLVVLKRALGFAMTQQLLTYNPATLIKVARVRAKIPVPLTLPHAKALLAACEGHRLGGLVAASLCLGLRVGEACGLTWADVDLDAGLLKIRQQIQPVPGTRAAISPLKTAASRRTLTMPVRLVALFEARRAAQRQERLKAGAAWKASDLVFTWPKGERVLPSVARETLAALIAEAKLPAIKYHTLRHTAATLLLADGTPLFDVSKILGHSSIEITADLYGHLVPDMTAGAASRMDRLLAR